MKTFHAKVTHDAGAFYVTTSASNSRAFIEKIQKAYNCPFSAISEITPMFNYERIRPTVEIAGTDAMDVRNFLKKLVEFREGELTDRPNLFECSDDPTQDYDRLITLLEYCEEAAGILEKVPEATR